MARRKLTDEEKRLRRFRMKLKKEKAQRAAIRAACYEEAFGFPTLLTKAYETPGVRRQIDAAKSKEGRYHNTRPKSKR